MTTGMVLRVLALVIAASAGCREERAELGTTSVHVDAGNAFTAFAAAAVTISAAYQSAGDEAGSNRAIDVLVEIGQLGQEGKLDFAEAGAILAAVDAARGPDGLLRVEDARPLVERATALLERSRPNAK